MLKVSSCPSVEEWARFLSGELPQTMYDLFAAHIATCPGCLDKVRNVSANDAFVQTIGKARVLPEGPDSEVISQLVDKIKSMKQVGPNDATVDLSTADSVASPGEGGEHGDEATDFLAPAQAPGEIGRLGPYRVLGVLGRGGMGVVFRAEDVALRRVVALKAMLPALAASGTAKKRFLREAQTAANIKHDHIVTIFQVGEDRGVPFMAMEYLHGETLEARLIRDRRLSPADVIRIGREIAEGLAAAHENGLIHRDIKPANIWLEKPGRGQTQSRVKILDFGLARSADRGSDLTQRGAIIGTPAYMAPEQTTGEPIDARADLFSLGCVMYLMATGQTPFRGKDSISTIMSVANDAAAHPRTINSDVPAELSDCIMRLLAKKPGDRPASADDLVTRLTALQSVRAGAPASPQPVAPPVARPNTLPQSPRGARRWPLVAALAGFVALVALGAVFFLPAPHGTIRVEVNDDDIEVVLIKTGVKIKTGDKHGDVVVAPGEHALHVKRGELEFDTDTFQLKRGEAVAVKLTFLKDKLQAALAGDRLIGSKVAATPGPAREKARYALRLACGEYAASEPAPKLDSVVTTYEIWVSQFSTVDQPDERLLSGPHGTLGFRSGKTEFYTVHAEVAFKGLPPQNQFVHLAGINDGKERRLYINGKLAATLDNPGNLDPSRDPAPIILGQGGVPVGEHIVSTIAQARISRVARYTKDFVPAQEFASDADTVALYRFKEGKGDVVKDSSGNGHHLKIQGAKWVKLAIDEADHYRWTPSKEQQAFFDAIAQLPEKSRCETVARKLTDLNRGRHGLPAVVPKFQPPEGPPTSCTISESFAANLWPLAALTSLEKLDISACSPTEYGWLTRLPLVELKAPLVVDNLAGERVLGSMPTLRTINDQPVSKFFANRAEIRKEIDSMADKAPTLPLADRAAWLGTMIKKLHPDTTTGVVLNDVHANGVCLHEDSGLVVALRFTDDHFYDISPLRVLGLDAVRIDSKCRVFDLSPLAKTKITRFRVYDNVSLRDITPLTGPPIKSLELNESMVGDLSPLKGTRIESLVLIFGSPYDETCLRGLPLKHLIFMGGSIKDLSVVKGAPLTRLSLRDTQVSDLAPLEGMKLEALDLSQCAVTDLTPVLKMPLKELFLPLKISDLAPLRGIPLVNLEFNGQVVKDLSPLKGMPLTRLSCLGGGPTDLTPIMGMPIRHLDITFVPKRDAAVLRSLKMLESINGQPAKGIIDNLP